MKYAKLYDAMLATPLRPLDVARGEITWALLRGACYSAVFIVIMVSLGLVHSWWMMLALPATLLIGFGFAGAGMVPASSSNIWCSAARSYARSTRGTRGLVCSR